VDAVENLLKNPKTLQNLTKTLQKTFIYATPKTPQGQPTHGSHSTMGGGIDKSPRNP
jgi:hypothetical protein